MQLEQHGCMIEDFLQQISDATVHKYPEVFLDLPPKDSDLHWGYSRFNDLDYISTFAYKCAKEFRTLLSEINAIAPLRNSPKRWYTYSGITPENTGYRGQTLPDLLFTNPDVINKTNEWLKRLGIEYQMKIVNANAQYDDLFEIRFMDLRRKNPVDVNMSDLGFGISQILPIIAQSSARQNQIITIEQPELHIHPKLQANLGDLFAESIRKGDGSTDEPNFHTQYIIETHSEHLVLRLQKLIRNKKLKADDVSVLYVSRGESGSTVERLRLDDDGEFIDEWPGGFFPERLKELL